LRNRWEVRPGTIFAAETHQRPTSGRQKVAEAAGWSYAGGLAGRDEGLEGEGFADGASESRRRVQASR
jgi:hypothetical protein